MIFYVTFFRGGVEEGLNVREFNSSAITVVVFVVVMVASCMPFLKILL